MEDAIRKTMTEMFPQLLQQNLMSFSNLSVPQHRHNGVDSPVIPFKNIVVNPGNGTAPTVDTGISLLDGLDMYNIYLLDTSGIAPLVIQPNAHAFNGGGADLYFGLSSPFSGTVFNRIFMNVDGAALSEEITLTATDTIGGGIDVGTFSVLAGNVSGTSSNGVDSATFSLLWNKFEFSATGDFAVQWPDTTLPTAVAGMFAFDAGRFYMALTNGTWTPVPTVPGTGGTVTSVGVNAPLTAIPSPITTAGTISIAQSTTSTDGYLSSTDWNTFNNKGSGTVTAVSVASANGFSGSSSGGATPALTLSTTISGVIRGNGTAISQAAADPSADTLFGWDNTDGANKYINIGSGLTYTHSTHTLSVSSTGFTWSVITADQTASINNGYLANKASLLTLTLPTTCAAGSVIRIAGMNAGLWKIAQGSGQQIHFGNVNTTSGAGGSLASTLTYDAVELVCSVANNEFVVLSSVGNITIV